MKQTYNVGYIQTPSVTHLANVKQTLVETGIVSPTTPNEMLPTAIEEGMQGFVKPTGTLEITENGTHDVTDKASVNVNVAGNSEETFNTTFFVGFKFSEAGDSYEPIFVDEEHFDVNIKAYNENDIEIPCNYAFIGFTRALSTYKPIDGMCFKLNFNREDKPTYFKMSFVGCEIDYFGLQGNGFVDNNISSVYGGLSVVKSDNTFYVISEGRIDVLPNSQIQFTIEGEKIYGGIYHGSLRSTSGGGGAD